MKKIIFLLASVLLSATLDSYGQGMPVRRWNDDMPRHTFSAGIGPALFSRNNPMLDTENLQNGNVTPVGFEATLRYDFSYLRGYEVSLGTGVFYTLSHVSMFFDRSMTLENETRVRETMHYAGVNLVDTKMWFGRRVIWDVAIHAGYTGGVTRLRAADTRSRLVENGFTAGVSTGLNCLVTAWLGIGIHLNAATGILYTQGSPTSREYNRLSARIGAVYCF